MVFSGKSRWTQFVFAAVAIALCSGTSFSQKVFYESGGMVFIECENTESALGEWVMKTTPPGFTGTCGLEFTGNSLAGGSPNSPLVYKFHVTNGGTYKHTIRAHSRLSGSPAGDHCDCWFKVEGDYTSGGTAPITFLKDYGKLFIFGLTNITWDYQDNFDHPGGSVFYNFKADQIYTVTIAGRVQRFNMDRFGFYKTTATDSLQFKADRTKASDPTIPESPTTPVGTIKTAPAQYLVPAHGNSAEVYSLTGQYFGRFPISATGKILTEGKIGTGNCITVMPGNVSQKRFVIQK